MRIVQSRFVHALLRLGIAGVLVFAARAEPRTPATRYQQAIEFHRRLDALHFAAFAWDLTVLAAMVAMRAGSRVRNAAEARIRSRAIARAAAAAILLAAPWVAALPAAAYRHALSLDYGISIQPWAPWFLDVVKAAAATGPPFVLLTLAALAIVRRSPRRWWIWSWALSALVLIAGTFAAPLLFDPLLFHFRPLAQSDPALVSALQEVAGRAGYNIPADRVFEMDASRKTRAVNAYMTGFGRSRRIVLWDTTLAVLTAPQIQTVFAHELGHYALDHIPRSIAVALAGLLALFWLAYRLAARIIGDRGPALGIRSLDDIAILPLVLLITTAIGFVSEPVVNGYSRWQEHQADVYELQAMQGLVAHPGRNSAEVDRIMAEIDLDDPDPSPFITFWLYDHPPTRERERFALEYDVRNQSPPL